MQKDLKTIEAAGVKVVGISYDSVDVLKTFADKHTITFPLLSDPGSKTIIAYSLRNPEVAGKKFGPIDPDGIPYPGTVVVGKDGVIKAKLFLENMKERHSTEALVKVAEALKK